MKRKPDDNTMIFGTRLRGLRGERNYSMDEFCEAFNKSQDKIRLNRSTVSRYEKGLQEPMASTIAALAAFFRVSPVYLLGATDDRNYKGQTITNSAVVQGNTATTLIVRNSIQNGEIQEREMSEAEVELFRIFEALNVKARTALLTAAYELEEKQAKGKI